MYTYLDKFEQRKIIVIVGISLKNKIPDTLPYADYIKSWFHNIIFIIDIKKCAEKTCKGRDGDSGRSVGWPWSGVYLTICLSKKIKRTLCMEEVNNEIRIGNRKIIPSLERLMKQSQKCGNWTAHFRLKKTNKIKMGIKHFYYRNLRWSMK